VFSYWNLFHQRLGPQTCCYAFDYNAYILHLPYWGPDEMQVIIYCFYYYANLSSAVYGSTSTNHSGVYGTVAAVFLFQGSYSFGWTPLAFMYAPEVLNYSIRANGMGALNFMLNAVG
jgi:hypothetical protein